MVSSWTINGKMVKDITDQNGIDYRRRVTALSTCGKDNYVVGYRDGVLELYNKEDKIVARQDYLPDGKFDGRHGFSNANGYVCKDRNQLRITSLTDYTTESKEEKFFVGTPSRFQLIDFKTGNVEVDQQIHANDWIYCINP